MAATTNRSATAVVIVGFLSLAVAFSTRATLGLVMPFWQAELGWSASFISGVAASALVVMALTAPLAGLLVDRVGARAALAAGLGLVATGAAMVASTSSPIVFAIGFGGFAAIGFGIVALHTVSTAIAMVYERNRGLATGIATSGSTAGQLLVVPLVAFLLTTLSWRWSFGGLAVMAALGMVFVLVMLPRPAMSGAGRRGSSASNLKMLLQSPVYHLLFWSFMLCGFTTGGVIETHLLPFSSFCGFPPLPSATAYGVLSAVNLGGMILAGYLSDRVNKVFLLAAIYALRAATFVILIMLPDLSIEWLFIFAIAFGLVDYSTVPVTAGLVASNLGVKVMGLAMGLLSGGHALGAAAGAFAGGYLFDGLGNYATVWFVAAALSALAAVLAISVPRGSVVLREAA
ncbi:MAG: MFS transporter [Tabrizicola sp.]|jgi:predicted MFS family arabinose efflux permease|nr:MFS transporter [Tabrizicola sp.]